MGSKSKDYYNLNGLQNDRESVQWYWRLIALAASWMILGGYLILPGLYDKDPQLKFSPSVLAVFVVALLTAGYSFTALLCFACRNEMFQAEAIFLPALTSSAIGLLSIAYNFLSSHRYKWETSAIAGTVLSVCSTILYALLLLWTHRRIRKLSEGRSNLRNSSALYSESQYYQNYVANVYPSAVSRAASPHGPPPPVIIQSEDDPLKRQMELLLKQPHPGPSPDAASATFRIDLPEDREERERQENSSELLGTPPVVPADWRARSRAASAGPPQQPGAATLGGQGWERFGSGGDRGRSPGARSTAGGASRGHSRAVSREERRREIELGQV